jgi:Ca2+-binding EF-hand superfamily protein
MKEHDRIYIEHFSFMDRDKFNNIIKENLYEMYQFLLYNKKTNKIYNYEFDEIVL